MRSPPLEDLTLRRPNPGFLRRRSVVLLSLLVGLPAISAPGCLTGQRLPDRRPESTPAPSPGTRPAPGLAVVELDRLTPNHLYFGHRQPLRAQPFRRLPMGAFQPSDPLRDEVRELIARLVSRASQGESTAHGLPANTELRVALSLLELAAAVTIDEVAPGAGAELHGWREELLNRLATDATSPGKDVRPLRAPLWVALHSARGEKQALNAARHDVAPWLESVEGTEQRADLESLVSAASALAWLYDESGDAKPLQALRDVAAALRVAGGFEDPTGSPAPSPSDPLPRGLAALAAIPFAPQAQPPGPTDEFFAHQWRRESRELLAGGAAGLRRAARALGEIVLSDRVGLWAMRLGEVTAKTVAPVQSQLSEHDAIDRSLALAWTLEHAWIATPGDGLGVTSYLPGSLQARVGEDAGAVVEIEIEIDSAGRGRGSAMASSDEGDVAIRIDIASLAPVRTSRFPIFLAPPDASRAVEVSLNQRQPVLGRPGRWLAVAREWRPTDRLIVRFR